MSMVKKQCRTYSVLELLLQSAYKVVMPTTRILVPTVQTPVCQTVFGRSPALFRMTAQSVCRYLQLSITTNLTQFHITDLKMEDSICQHSELGTIQSSPINLFLTVRINLISYFRRTYWTSQIDIQWQIRNHPGKGWTCFWLIQRLIATKSKKSWCPFLLLAPYSSGDLRPENWGGLKILLVLSSTE